MGDCIRAALIVVFGALLASAVPLQNKSLRGDKKCDAGPGVWCSNLGYAKACNAVNYCIENVWSNKLLKNDESIFCTECNAMVARTRFLLSEGQDVKNMYDLVRFECSRVSIADVREKCNLLAENLLSEFDQLLASNMNEAQTCAALGFCRDLRNNNPKSRHFEIENPQQEEFAYKEGGTVLNIPNNEFLQTLEYEVYPPEIAINSNVTLPFTCLPCRRILKNIQKLINITISQDEITLLFSTICYISPSEEVREGCQSQIKKIVGLVLAVIQGDWLPKSVCKYILLCGPMDDTKVEGIFFNFAKDVCNTAEEVPEEIEISEKKSNKACHICKHVSSAMRHKFVAMDRQDLLDNILNMCSEMDSLANVCANAVINHFNEVHDHITKNMDAFDICDMTGMCSDELNEHYKEISKRNEVEDGDNPALCVLCTEYIKFLKVVLNSDAMESQIKVIAQAVCEHCPLLRKSCKDFVDKNYDLIYKSLVNILDGRIPCIVLGVCPRPDEGINIQDEIEMSFGKLDLNRDTTEKKSNNACHICKHVSSAMRQKFVAMDRQDLLDNILNMCSEMDSLANVCANAVINHFNEVHDHITKNMDAFDICDMTGMCSDELNEHYKEISKRNEVEDGDNPALCVLCTEYIKFLKVVLNSDAMESQIKVIAQAVCEHCPLLRKSCKDFVDKNYDLIYKSLVNILDGRIPCIVLGVCPRPDEGINIQDEIEMSFGKLDLNRDTTEKKSNNACHICKHVSSAMRHKFVAMDRQDLLDNILNMCSEMDSLANVCANAVINHFNEVHDHITKNMDAFDICDMTGMCSGEVNEHYKDISKRNEVEDGDNPALCVLCTEYIKFLKVVLNSDAMESQIKVIAQAVCEHCPLLRKSCKDFVDKNYDLIYKSLVNILDGRIPCIVLGVCPRPDEGINIQDEIEMSFGKLDLNRDTTEKKSNNACHICKHVSSAMRHKFVAMDRQDLLDNILNMCSKMDSFADVCMNAVLTHFNEVHDHITQNMEAFDICDITGVCSVALNKHDKRISTKNEVAETGNIIFCMLCRKYIDFLKKVLETNAMESVLKGVAQAVCWTCPVLRRSCKEFVDKNFDLIYKSLVNILDGRIPCTVLGVCARTDEVMNTQDDANKARSKDSENEDPDDEFTVSACNLPNTETIEYDVSASGITLPPNCQACKDFIKSIQTIINSTISKDNLTRTMEQGCHLLPTKAARDKCCKVVGKYGRRLADFIYNPNSAQVVCKKIRLCRAEDQAVEVQANECNVCLGASTNLLLYIKQNQGLPESEESITSVACAGMPTQYDKTCADLISNYGQAILALAAKDGSDEPFICSSIGKCLGE